MKADAEIATEKQVQLFRSWMNCPEDYRNTPRELATQAYQKLYKYPIHVEAHQLLSYMRGELDIPIEHFKAMEDVYMCESSDDREAVRIKLLQELARGNE